MNKKSEETSRRTKIAKLIVLKMAEEHGTKIQSSLFLQYLKDLLRKVLGKQVSWRTVSRYIEEMERQGLIREEDGFTFLNPWGLTTKEILAIKTAYEKLMEERRVRND